VHLNFPSHAQAQEATAANLGFISQAELESLWQWFYTRANLLRAEGHQIRKVWIHRFDTDAAKCEIIVEGCIRSRCDAKDTTQVIGMMYGKGKVIRFFIGGIPDSNSTVKFLLFGAPPMRPMDF
jgi:hypothetical protein